MKKIFVLLMVVFAMLFSVSAFAAEDGFGVSDRVSVDSGKNFLSELGIRGYYEIVLRGPSGEIKEVRRGHNYVVQNGLYSIMDQILASPTLAKMAWMAVGTGSISGTCTANGVSLNTLTTELSRVAVDSKTRGSNAIITQVATWGAGVGTGALTEAGTFSHSATTTNDMWMCASFAVINKGASDSLQITWTLTGS